MAARDGISELVPLGQRGSWERRDQRGGSSRGLESESRARVQGLTRFSPPDGPEAREPAVTQAPQAKVLFSRQSRPRGRARPLERTHGKHRGVAANGIHEREEVHVHPSQQLERLEKKRDDDDDDDDGLLEHQKNGPNNRQELK